MAKLVCRALRCVEETDEVGNDDIYMIVFRGSISTPPDVNVVGGKGSAWDGMKTGKLVEKDVVLDDAYASQHAYVIAMLEQDWARDILTEGAWGKIAQFWANNWMNFKGDAGRLLCAQTALVLFGALDNDELVGIKSVPQIFGIGGDGVLLKFSGDGGYYRARIVQRA